MVNRLRSLLRRPPKASESPAPHREASPPSQSRSATPPRPAAHHPATHDGPVAHEFGETPRPPRRRNRGRRSGVATAERGASPTAQTPPAVQAPHPEAFKALGIDPAGLDAVAALGFTEPTPIQAEALPLLLEGNDVVGLAQTGSGKTLAFGIPLARSVDPTLPHVQALVLVPTRELAAQVLQVMIHLGKFYGFTSIGLTGGHPLKRDFEALDRPCQVIVGTPGRVMDHLMRGTLSLREVRYVALDEADEMLDIGFARAIDSILRRVPSQRRTALFSATMPMTIKRLVHRYMDHPETVAIEPQQRTVATVRQVYIEVAQREKLDALRWLYEERGIGRSLIFLNTRAGVDRLAAHLASAGLAGCAIHGDLRQSERDRVMRDFRAGKIEFLVATNVAARGLDIPDIENVINYDVPQNAEEYVHRIGRTARAGKEGTAVTFVAEWDLDVWDLITAHVGPENLERLTIPRS